MNHTVISVIVTLVLGFVFQFFRLQYAYFWAAGLITMYFAGREVAQAEYRWIEHHGKGLRANLRWNSIWTTKGIWTMDALIVDFLVPMLVAFAVAMFVASGLEKLLLG